MPVEGIIALMAAFVIGFAGIATAYNEGADKRFRWSPPLLMGGSIMLGMFAGMAASAGEAGTAGTTKIGPVHEHAVPKGQTPTPHTDHP